MGLFGLAEEPPFGQTENGLASIKRHASAKFAIKKNADDDDEGETLVEARKIEKGEAYHLVPKSILWLNIRVIWKVNNLGFSSIF